MKSFIDLIDIFSLNSQNDENLANNNVSTTFSNESSYETITFIINADDYPQETSWKLFYNTTGQIFSSGSLNANT